MYAGDTKRLLGKLKHIFQSWVGIKPHHKSLEPNVVTLKTEILQKLSLLL